MSSGIAPIRNIDVGLKRIEAFQPRLSTESLAEGVLHTEDPLLLHGLGNLVRVWAASHPDLSASFAQNLRVVEAARQPIGWAVVEAQEMRRTLQAVEEPHSGGAINSSPFRTRDLYELAPLVPTMFPNQSVCEQLNVSGQESISPCPVCEGGATPCQSCGGAGMNLCSQCGGAQTISCSRCNGAGQHQGVSGRIVNCQLCGTRGTTRCTACSKGRVECGDCTGTGEIKCIKCAGHGHLKQRWTVVSDMRTTVNYHPFMLETWNVPFEAIWAHGDELDSRVRAWPDRNPEGIFAGIVMPDSMASGVAQLIDNCLLPETKAGKSAPRRVTGIRVRLLATYAYRLRVEFDGRQGLLLVVGNSNRIVVESLPTARVGRFGKLLEAVQRKLSVLDLADFVGLPPEFVNGIKSGEVHICDSHCLVSRAAIQLGATYRVTADGYDVLVHIGSEAGEIVKLNVAMEIDRQKQWILRIGCRLGPVYRERAPHALAHNASLTFGRIAVTRQSAAEGEYFEMIDVRPYEQTKVEHLARIFQVLAADVLTLQQTRLLA